MTFAQQVDRFLDQNGMYHFEGPRGVSNLEKLVAHIDSSYQTPYGDHNILNFLSDNPGAIEAVIDWIKKQRSPEWAETLSHHIDDHT